MSTQFPEAFDPATHEGNSWDVLPAGEYVAQVVEASIQQPNSGDGYYLSLTWKIIEGAYEGRQVWQRITYQHSSEQAQTFGRKTLKDLCVATEVAEQVDDAEVFLFKPVRIRLGIERDKQGVYPDENRISRIMSLETKPVETEQPARPAAPATKAAVASGVPRNPQRPRSLARATLRRTGRCPLGHDTGHLPHVRASSVSTRGDLRARDLLVAGWRQSARNDGDGNRQERRHRAPGPRHFAPLSNTASSGCDPRPRIDRQDLEPLLALWPEAPVGINSAGIGQRERDAPIIFAGVQSVWRDAAQLGARHLVLIDEAHLVATRRRRNVSQAVV